MHAKRWITAIVIVPPLIALVLWGGSLPFSLLVILVSILTLREYYGIVFKNHAPAVSPFYYLWGYFNATLIIIAAAWGNQTTLLAPLTVNLLGAAFVSFFRFKTAMDAPIVVVKQTFGLVYIALFLSCAVRLFASPQGPLWILFLLAVLAGGDTGAYYTGTYLGRHKLCPSVSPKKTIEGALGGLAANLVVALMFKLFFFPSLSVMNCMLMSLVIGMVGQVGDLFESEFKRAADIKDSGKLLPGHGGFLDRIDALLFALPVACLLKDLLLS